MGITRTQIYPDPQNVHLLTYKELFSTSENKQSQIIKAAGRLGLMLNQPMDRGQLQGWSQELEMYDPLTLAEAFREAERTMEAWPTVSKIIRLIGDRQFRRDLDYLFQGIRECAWEDNYFTSTPSLLPEPSERLRNALRVFVGGSAWKKGLTRLSSHPGVTGYRSVDGSEESERTASRLEKEFRAAWDRAQMEGM